MILTKRERRAKAKAEGKALFSITLDEREMGGGSITIDGIASEDLREKLARFIREEVAK
jgi:hypothetical protein